MPCVQKREFSCPVTGVRLQGIGGLPMKDVPIWDKLRTLSDGEHCRFVLWVGSKRLIKRRRLDEYLDKVYSI